MSRPQEIWTNVWHALAMPILVIGILYAAAYVGELEAGGGPAAGPSSTSKVTWESLEISSAERLAWEKLGKTASEANDAIQTKFSYDFTMRNLFGLFLTFAGIVAYFRFLLQYSNNQYKAIVIAHWPSETANDSPPPTRVNGGRS